MEKNWLSLQQLPLPKTELSQPPDPAQNSMRSVQINPEHSIKATDA